jgi:CIC family chloride channel protein
LLGKWSRWTEADRRALLAAGAGAGLATAFNAPIAAAVFVLEELVRRFEPRVAIAALSASAGAMAVARIFLGSAPDFQVPPMEPPGPGCVFLFALLGVVAGLAGAGYTQAILGALRLADRLPRAMLNWRAAAVGAGVAIVAWFAPSWVGGGEGLTQATLAGDIGMRTLPFLFAFRFLFGAVSYAAATPGGLFAPLLVLGAQTGVLFAALCPSSIRLLTHQEAFPLVGMAAFFVAVVGSPLTGIVLVAELSGSYNLFLQMLAAGAAALVVAKALGSPPIYDVLKIRTLDLEARRADSHQLHLIP